ncbi:MAG: hypothetical protein WB443_10495 [Nitrososphaeraceae archaeon]
MMTEGLVDLIKTNVLLKSIAGFDYSIKVLCMRDYTNASNLLVRPDLYKCSAKAFSFK